VYLHNAPFESPTPWFHGQVIDMLFFPILEFYWPHWVPVVGGEYFMFFSPVFNIADSAIFLGVLFIILFQRTYFKTKDADSIAISDNPLAENTSSAIPGVSESPALNEESPPTQPLS
jgi:signal peptidase II